ncbi:MAG: chorismate mutase [Spirochaetaceae bacterium]|nr:MAG: chorismate mutase [Spirochaetaceae bacterium]
MRVSRGDTDTPLDLDVIAAQLEALEESIMYRFIDRAQFAWNPRAYEAGAESLQGAQSVSLFHARLRAQEELEARFGRYQVPEERPFTSGLPDAERTAAGFHASLRADDWNVVRQSDELLEAYLATLPELCEHRDDGHYGSSVEHDVSVLQAVSRRVHFGALYVAEAKFCRDTEAYRRAIRRADAAEIEAMLTRADVERAIIERLRRKMQELQTEVHTRVRRVISPDVVVGFYRDTIIPRTKAGQVAYLLQRLEHEPS